MGILTNYSGDCPRSRTGKRSLSLSSFAARYELPPPPPFPLNALPRTPRERERERRKTLFPLLLFPLLVSRSLAPFYPPLSSLLLHILCVCVQSPIVHAVFSCMRGGRGSLSSFSVFFVFLHIRPGREEKGRSKAAAGEGPRLLLWPHLVFLSLMHLPYKRENHFPFFKSWISLHTGTRPACSRKSLNFHPHPFCAPPCFAASRGTSPPNAGKAPRLI